MTKEGHSPNHIKDDLTDQVSSPDVSVAQEQARLERSLARDRQVNKVITYLKEAPRTPEQQISRNFFRNARLERGLEEGRDS